MKNPKAMSFSEDIDKTEAKGEHKFYFSFSKKFIKGKKVLDLGSWTGPYTSLIYGLAKEISAVDVEEKALKVLKKNLPKVKTSRAFSDKLPFKEGEFDVVTFWDVIEHIPVDSELVTLKEINRVIKKGGILFLATVKKNFWSDILDPAYYLAGHRHYTQRELSNILKASGFKIQEVISGGSFFSSFYALSFYFFKHILRMKMPTIKFVEKKMEEDMMKPGYIQIVIRAKKIN